MFIFVLYHENKVVFNKTLIPELVPLNFLVLLLCKLKSNFLLIFHMTELLVGKFINVSFQTNKLLGNFPLRHLSRKLHRGMPEDRALLVQYCLLRGG